VTAGLIDRDTVLASDGIDQAQRMRHAAIGGEALCQQGR
jgi:hypothetical protein